MRCVKDGSYIIVCYNEHMCSYRYKKFNYYPEPICKYCVNDYCSCDHLPNVYNKSIYYCEGLKIYLYGLII